MVLVTTIFDIFCIVECCSTYWIPNDFEELDLRLEKQLIGQPLAHKLIHKSISSHVSNPNPSKALVLSFHGSTGTGKNFVARHIIESLYRKGFRSEYVRFYVVSRDFMHTDPVHISQYKDRLTREIEEVTNSCQQAIFVFDEIDQMPKQLLDIILYYIDFHTPTRSRPIDFRKTIFIFLSNAGSTSIINLTKNNYLSSIKRQDYQILEFEKILSNASFNEKGGLEQTALIDKHLITFFVPFLPLEREHIRDCIKEQLEVMLDDDEYEYEFVPDDIINRVMNLIEFFSLSSFEYSLSGCKKVQQKLFFLFESIRPSLKKTKKKSNSVHDIL